MATLKYAMTCRLARPAPPTRKCIQSTTDALHHLGFDVGFDLQLECAADVIEATDVKVEQRIADAVEFAKERRLLREMPCAFLQFTKAFKEEPELPTEEALQEASSAVAQAMASLGVLPEHVSIEAVEGVGLRGCVQVASGPWLLAACEALADATKDRGGGLERGDPTGIHRALAAAGGAENLVLPVVPVFALERCSEELSLAFDLRDVQADFSQRLSAAAAASRKVLQDAWMDLHVDDVVKEELQALAKQEQRASFGGRLLPVVEGLQQGLSQDFLEHGATTLRDVEADAVEAHARLKVVLAPKTAWATAALNDVYDAPLGDARRRWTSSADALAPDCEHFDPGVRSARWVLDKAKRAMRPEDVRPAVHREAGISRLILTFDSARSIVSALEGLSANTDLVSVSNMVANPTASGYRYVEVIVRVGVGGDRAHYCTIELHLRALADARSAADAACGDLHAALSAAGVKAWDLERATSLALRTLGCTHGQAARDSEDTWRRVASRVQELRAEGGEYLEELLDELVYEVKP